MPADTILVLAAVIAMFGFFAAVLIFSDMTWSDRAQKVRKPTDASKREA